LRGGIVATRIRYLATILAVALATTPSQAAISSASMPDMERQYYERQNCHGAYDVLSEQLDGGSQPSEAEIAWAKSYEDNARSGVPCPAPRPRIWRGARATAPS
jgi:uncharacterized protein